ncbi:putative phosphatase [Podospora conica]|nr:putative phosphatase [Schizothecium conicum]
MMPPRKITTLMLDCDNTLVLSEELAFEACADLINEIIKNQKLPIDKTYTGPILMSEFVGQNFRGMLATLLARCGKQLDPDKMESYVRREEDAVIAKLEEKLVACPGVDAVLPRLRDKGYKLGVVSSSALRRVKASIEKVGQAQYFGDDVYSAASSLPRPTSKPDPAVYLHALEKMGVKAENCVAVEDSKSGTLAAMRAGIKVVGYVGPYEEGQKEAMEKTLKEAGAAVVMRDWSEFEACLAKIEKGLL